MGGLWRSSWVKTYRLEPAADGVCDDG
eukprot:COSAG03_NODE_12977_length_523_cov_0.719340_1_plen_26_part_10